MVQYKIQLTQGKYALVSRRDYYSLRRYKWYAERKLHTWYAKRKQTMTNGKQCHVWMHRVILNLKRGDTRQGDHRNGNGLDNRRCNLRIATHAQNTYNSRKHRNTHNPYIGVFRNSTNSSWVAVIRHNKSPIYLGSFSDSIDAAKAYDKQAKKLRGKFAKLNFN